MKWQVKIWLSPVVQEEPEVFIEPSINDAMTAARRFVAHDLAARTGKPFTAIRKIEITPHAA